jgi:hypothetical protein
LGVDQLECRAHVDVRAPPRELGGKGSKIGSILAVKGIYAKTMSWLSIATDPAASLAWRKFEITRFSRSSHYAHRGEGIGQIS